jgi:hypothetical protein
MCRCQQYLEYDTHHTEFEPEIQNFGRFLSPQPENEEIRSELINLYLPPPPNIVLTSSCRDSLKSD